MKTAGIPVIPARVQPTVITKPYKQKNGWKGALFVLAGIVAAGMISKLIPGNRFDWVEKDYHTYQGNYLGVMVKGQKDYLVVVNHGKIRSFEIHSGITLSLPHQGGLVEVHYTSETYPRIVRGQDIRALHVPNPDPGYEQIPTRYGTL
jgi:hypothetical protein